MNPILTAGVMILGVLGLFAIVLLLTFALVKLCNFLEKHGHNPGIFMLTFLVLLGIALTFVGALQQAYDASKTTQVEKPL